VRSWVGLRRWVLWLGLTGIERCGGEGCGFDMVPDMAPAEQSIDALAKWFGPGWTWSEIAIWIESRSRADQMPRFAILWASEFLRVRREQENAWKD